MAKVIMGGEQPPMPPSSQVLAKAKQTYSVIDALGRNLILRKPGILATYAMIEALGADLSKNTTYVNMVLPIVYLVSVDDMEVIQPSTVREVKAILQMLEEEGIAALMEGIEANFGKQDPEADRLAIKK